MPLVYPHLVHLLIGDHQRVGVVERDFELAFAKDNEDELGTRDPNIQTPRITCIAIVIFDGVCSRNVYSQRIARRAGLRATLTQACLRQAGLQT